MRPLALALLIGVALLIACCVAVVGVKSVLEQLGASAVALGKLARGMILFAIYALVSLCQLGCYSCECLSLDAWRGCVHNERRREVTFASSSASGRATGMSANGEQPQVAVLFLRVAFSLLLACVCAGRARVGRARRATCATRSTRATTPCRPSRSLRAGGCGC